MKYLGIDYGSKRVGFAISDESFQFAFPLVVLPNTDSLLDEIVEICSINEVGEIVVGESKNFNQQDNEIMKKITPFVSQLSGRLTLPVHLHPEFMTSAEALHGQGKNDMLDASAAALILKSYLDTHIHNTHTHDHNR